MVQVWVLPVPTGQLFSQWRKSPGIIPVSYLGGGIKRKWSRSHPDPGGDYILLASRPLSPAVFIQSPSWFTFTFFLFCFLTGVPFWQLFLVKHKEVVLSYIRLVMVDTKLDSSCVPSQKLPFLSTPRACWCSGSACSLIPSMLTETLCQMTMCLIHQESRWV